MPLSLKKKTTTIHKCGLLLGRVFQQFAKVNVAALLLISTLATLAAV